MNIVLSRSIDYNLHVAIFDSVLRIAFGISFGSSFLGCCPLKRPVFIAGIEIIDPCVLIHLPAEHLFQSRITGPFPL